MAKKRKKMKGKRKSKIGYMGFGGGKKKSRRKPPRGGTPVKAFAVARDSRGRLAGFKKISVSDFKAA